MFLKTYDLPIWLWSLSTAEVAQSPGSVTEHAKLAAVAEEGQKWLEGTAGQNVVPACWGITSNVTKRPHGLLSYIWLVGAEELDEYWDGAGLNDDLGLSGGAGSNVG